MGTTSVYRPYSSVFVSSVAFLKSNIPFCEVRSSSGLKTGLKAQFRRDWQEDAATDSNPTEEAEAEETVPEKVEEKEEKVEKVLWNQLGVCSS